MNRNRAAEQSDRHCYGVNYHGVFVYITSNLRFNILRSKIHPFLKRIFFDDKFFVFHRCGKENYQTLFSLDF